MNNRILEQLEFDKVKQLFAGYLQTEQGQDELRKLEPMTDPDRISRSFDEISDMEQIFIEHHSFGMGSLRDISESMRRLELMLTLISQKLSTSRKSCNYQLKSSIFIMIWKM